MPQRRRIRQAVRCAARWPPVGSRRSASTARDIARASKIPHKAASAADYSREQCPADVFTQHRVGEVKVITAFNSRKATSPPANADPDTPILVRVNLRVSARTRRR